MNLIETVGLQDHMHKRSSELSGGMKRRLRYSACSGLDWRLSFMTNYMDRELILD